MEGNHREKIAGHKRSGNGNLRNPDLETGQIWLDSGVHQLVPDTRRKRSSNKGNGAKNTQRKASAWNWNTNLGLDQQKKKDERAENTTF